MHAQAVQVDDVVRKHGENALRTHDPVEERRDRLGEDDSEIGRGGEQLRKEGQVEMVEVLVGDQQPVDSLDGERQRRERDRAQLVRD